MKVKTLILGSGIGGLAAGAALKANGEHDFIIVDRTPSLPMNLHNGLHYLHSSDFPKPFHFDFKKVTLTEEVWNVRKDEFTKCATLPQMFEYSKKIMENLRHPSSIMDPGKRQEVWVPESNNMNDLLQAYHDYIGEEKFIWSSDLNQINIEKHKIAFGEMGDEIEYENCISTIPINVFEKLSGVRTGNDFKHKTIYITNYKTTNIVSNWLIVLYISDPKFKPYRMTVMNGILSMESIDPMTPDDKVIVKYHCDDLFDYDLSSENSYAWDTGRIFGLTPDERKTMIDAFAKKDIHLLGRFATWNGKTLMDSTIRDANKITELLHEKTRIN